MQVFNPKEVPLTQYLFFTGKGGVGKTSVASATAINLADQGYKVTLVSTDPASNLQDVFEMPLSHEPRPVANLKNLRIANFNPDQAVEDYKEKVIGPYRDLLPQEALDNMEEQLSGSCTIEVAQFNEFAFFLSDEEVRRTNDYVLFDTAPTGHTLRMLELPSAWTTYFDENTTGVSCMGQLSGLTQERERYEQALAVLNDPKMTSLYIVTRPQEAAINEANRASQELASIGIRNQSLIVNGYLSEGEDPVAEAYRHHQERALAGLAGHLALLKTYYVPLRPYNVIGFDNLRRLLDPNQPPISVSQSSPLKDKAADFEDLVDDLIAKGRQIVFTMGKGVVGKSSIAVKLAQSLKAKGKKVRLATTDPADHLHLYLKENQGIMVDHIDEKEELEKYSQATLEKSRQFMDEDQLDYVKEDLKSPCTQEIAVFQAFARIVDKASPEEMVVLDTAPTGHTILLLKSSQAYSHEIERSSGEVDQAAIDLLPRLQSEQAEVVMVTLAEATPYYETQRLAEDLDRAGINHHWWLVNQSLSATETQDPVLAARASAEKEWLNKISQAAQGNYVILPWDPTFNDQ